MMKLRIVLAALLASAAANAPADARVDAIRGRLGPGDGAVIAEGRHTLHLLGEISPVLARDFTSLAGQGGAIDTVVVDSQGGDLASALDIAALIHQRKFNIVVDGRCFSACASYLFPAGNVKSVRPHSYLGIHSKTWHYRDGATLRHSTRLDEVQSALKKNADQEAERVLEGLQKKEAAFIKAAHLSASLDVAFASYMRHRELALSKGSGATACPKIDLWVLGRKQAESIGLKNIGQFWEPRTAEEYRLLQVYFSVPAAESFFGDPAALTSLCTAGGKNPRGARFGAPP